MNRFFLILLLPVVIHAYMYGGTIAKELGIDHENLEAVGLRYALPLSLAVKFADEEHREEINAINLIHADSSQQDLVVIQVFSDSPGTVFSLRQWVVTSTLSTEIPGQHISIPAVHWTAFSRLIRPSFTEVHLSASTKDYRYQPLSFIRVLIKTEEYSGIHYYINPLGAIVDGIDSFNSQEGWQNAYQFACALDNLRLVSKSDVFSAIGHKNLGQSYFTADELTLLVAAEDAFPGDLKKAIATLTKHDEDIRECH